MPSRLEEERKLICRLSRLPRHFQLNADSVELGSCWPDMCVAAALLSRTAYWLGGPVTMENAYEPASLKMVIRKIDVSGRVFVVYVLGGDPEHLRTLRWYYGGGCLYVHPEDRKKRLKELIEIYLDAKEKGDGLRRATTGASNV